MAASEREEVLADRTRAPEAKEAKTMISYNLHRVAQLIKERSAHAVSRDHVEEAATLLDASFPEQYHRRIQDRDVVRVAVALTVSRDAVRDVLNQIADELHYYPDVS
jgi:hypothetical protein